MKEVIGRVMMEHHRKTNHTSENIGMEVFTNSDRIDHPKKFPSGQMKSFDILELVDFRPKSYN